jgi:hypothetical protein
MELKRVRCRLGEQERSAYDFKAIREEMSKVPPPHLDHATFVGPVTVKVSWSGFVYDKSSQGW